MMHTRGGWAAPEEDTMNQNDVRDVRDIEHEAAIAAHDAALARVQGGAA